MSLLAVIGDDCDYTAIYYKASPYSYSASTVFGHFFVIRSQVMIQVENVYFLLSQIMQGCFSAIYMTLELSF